jgi:hypothetical protein
MATKRSWIAAAVIASAWLSAVTAQKVPELRINRGGPTSWASLQQIAAAGSSVFVVWQDRRSGRDDVYFSRSLDHGASWLENDLRVNTDAPGIHEHRGPQIAASGLAVYVAWLDDRNASAVYFNRSLDGGTTWLPADLRLDRGAPIGYASLQQIVAAGSAVYVVWQDRRNGRDDIYCNRSLDGGTTWLQDDVRVNTDPPAVNEHRAPQVAASGSSVYVTWLDSRSGNATYFNRSLDGGTSWLPADLRLDRGAPMGYASLQQIAAADSSVHVVWQDRRNGRDDTYCNCSLDGGATWLANDVRVNRDPPAVNEHRVPQVAAAESMVHVAWLDSRSGAAIYFNRSTDGGITWLNDDVRIDRGSPIGVASLQQVAASGSLVSVTWQDRRNGRDDVYFNRSRDGGATWLADDVRLNTDPLAVNEHRAPQIAVSESSVYATWQDSRSGSATYFNIPFGLQPYGAGKAGSGGWHPALAGDGSAVIGTMFELRVSQAYGGASAALLLGGIKTALPLLGGTILVGPPLIAPPLVLSGLPAVPGAGALSLPLMLPDDEAFVGGALYFQVLVLDPGATGGVSMSNGVELWIG